MKLKDMTLKDLFLALSIEQQHAIKTPIKEWAKSKVKELYIQMRNREKYIPHLSETSYGCMIAWITYNFNLTEKDL